jgi:hypothetical protein
MPDAVLTPAQVASCRREVEQLARLLLDAHDTGRWPPPDGKSVTLGLARSSLRLVRHDKAKEATNGTRSS